jgi:hypothetical protein
LIRSPEAAIKEVPNRKPKAKAAELIDANKGKATVSESKKVLSKATDIFKGRELSPPIQASAAPDDPANPAKFTALPLWQIIAGIALAACVFSALAQPLPQLLGLCPPPSLLGSMVYTDDNYRSMSYFVDVCFTGIVFVCTQLQCSFHTL